MAFKKDGAPDYFWFQPLRVLYEEGGEYSPQFQFWQSIIGGSEGQDLYFTEDFCSLGEPPDLEWSLENLVAFGSENLLQLYAKRIMFQRYCDSGGGA